ncbi:hypothetical protein C7M84_007669, partial [Penaeus vannamei]
MVIEREKKTPPPKSTTESNTWHRLRPHPHWATWADVFSCSLFVLPAIKMSSTMNGVESDDETPQVSITSESDDDLPQLSAGTMAALMEFFKEEEERKDKLRQIEEGEIPDTFEEDWNMSQFWYAEETSNSLAQECLRLAGNNGTIACVSSPTLYRTLRGMDHECK